MSRESRDGKRPHESDDDARSNQPADQNDQDEEQSQDESQDSGQSLQHDRQHRREHNHCSDAESRGEHEHHFAPRLERRRSIARLPTIRTMRTTATPRIARPQAHPHHAHGRLPRSSR